MTDDIARFEGERLDAERRYNDALTALDRVVTHAATLASLTGDAAAALGTALIVFLQQITAFVDTKDRQITARLASRLAEHEQALAAIPELRTHITVLRREVAHLRSPDIQPSLGASHQPPASPQPPARSPQPAAPRLRSPETQASFGEARQSAEGATAAGHQPANADVAYIAFEDRFRGSADDIREKLRGYVPLFAGASDVLDVGCGRGEFLDLLRQAGVRARGVDRNREMVADARDRGVDAVEADALAYMSSVPDASLGGLIAAQVVEHLEPSYLIRLLECAFHALRPGSPIVLETINPACWLAFFSSYLRDFTHVRPVHPDTLQYLLQAIGFERVSIRYSAPVPEQVKMRAVDLSADTVAARDPASRAIAGVAHAVNANAAILNSLLFSHLDYAAIGYRS